MPGVCVPSRTTPEKNDKRVIAMAKMILVTPRGYANYGQEARKRLEALGYEMDINTTGKALSPEAFAAKAKEATGIIVGVDECDRALLSRCKNLRAIVKFGVGTDNIDLDAAKEFGIAVGRCVGSNSNSVAEYTVGVMFAAAKHIVASADNVKNGGWDKLTGCELLGKTVGIIGFGNVGKNVARICSGIGMKTLAYDVFDIPEQALKAYNTEKRTVEEILRVSDFITVHVPLTAETTNMIASPQFDRMKPSAVLINAARGGIVHEKDLLDALKSGKIYAAAADVFTSEPPAADDWIQELLHLDNFILTSHIAARTAEAEINTVNISTDVMMDLLSK